MEFILYVLISMSMNSGGNLNLYTPTTYTTELECDKVRTEMLDSIKSDYVIGFTSICIEITVVPKGGETVPKEDKTVPT